MNPWPDPDPDPAEPTRSVPIPIRPVGRRATPWPLVLVPAALALGLTWMLLGRAGGTDTASTPSGPSVGAPAGGGVGDGTTTTVLPSAPDGGPVTLPSPPGLPLSTVPAPAPAPEVPSTTTAAPAQPTDAPPETTLAPMPTEAVTAALPCGEPIRLEITFGPDSWTLDEAGLAEISRVAALLPPGARLQLDGYTDERETSMGNPLLSKLRAEAARDALVAAGIATELITPAGHGSDDPIDDGHDETAWAKNRRITMTLSC